MYVMLFRLTACIASLIPQGAAQILTEDQGRVLVCLSRVVLRDGSLFLFASLALRVLVRAKGVSSLWRRSQRLGAEKGMFM